MFIYKWQKSYTNKLITFHLNIIVCNLPSNLYIYNRYKYKHI